MAICPVSAIEVAGRDLSKNDIFTLSTHSPQVGYEHLMSLLQKRRAVRDFEDREIEPDLIDKIITAAQTAPMGLPPSDVNLLVVSGKEKNKEFIGDFITCVRSFRFIFSPLFLVLLRPFQSKATNRFFKDFINPLIATYLRYAAQGKNVVTYGAPLTLYFYGTAYSDPADPAIAATCAMLAGESLGLQTCMIGAIHPFIQNGPAARRFRGKYMIRCKSRHGLAVIFGYPKLQYLRGIKRRFASVHWC